MFQAWSLNAIKLTLCRDVYLVLRSPDFFAIPDWPIQADPSRLTHPERPTDTLILLLETQEFSLFINNLCNTMYFKKYKCTR